MENLTITLVTAVHICAAVFMILVVLVQGGNSGGVSAAFGGGNSSGVFGASGGNSFFAKLTYSAALVFMVTSVYLSWDASRSTRSSIDPTRIEEEAKSVPEPVNESVVPPQTPQQEPVE